jgi:hypothetical protein
MRIEHLISGLLLYSSSCVIDVSDEAVTAGSAAATEAPDGERGVLELCRILAYDKPEVRAKFCLSQLDRGVAGRCWAHWLRTPIAWRNWCEREFSY